MMFEVVRIGVEVVVVRLLIAEEPAAALRISRWHAYALMRRNAIRSVQIGRLRRVREEDLRRFIERRNDLN
jgi:excisionase family DNA binding protein